MRKSLGDHWQCDLLNRDVTGQGRATTVGPQYSSQKIFLAILASLRHASTRISSNIASLYIFSMCSLSEAKNSSGS